MSFVVHSLIHLLFPWVWCQSLKPVLRQCSKTGLVTVDFIALYTCSCLLYPWVQCQSLKPGLSQCSQTSFVTVDDFIALYTGSYVFYSNGCNVFKHTKIFFTLADTISYRLQSPIFTMITEVWPCANRDMVRNNLNMIIKVALIQVFLFINFRGSWRGNMVHRTFFVHYL